jgi:sulfofructose kinase
MVARSEPWDVVGIGENSIDLVTVLPEYPQPAGALAKMRMRSRQLYCGGQTATAMCACASLGLRSKYVGVTGNDTHGRLVRAGLEQRNVDVADVIIRDVDNRFAIVLVDESSGERVVLWDADAQLRLRADELPVDSLLSARVVHVDDVDEDTAIRAADLARSAGVFVTSDIDRATGRTLELVASVTHAIFSQHVPSRLTGLDDAESAIRALGARFNNVLCVTLGARGAMALEHGRLHHAPGFAVRAVDTTGAGDVFRAGFIYALVHGLPLDEALRMGNAAAAVSCTRIGAINSVPTLEEVRALTSGAIAPG